MKTRVSKVLILLLSLVIFSTLLIACGSNKQIFLQGRYYCPEKDTESYIIDFYSDGTVDTYYSGKGTYSITPDGVFKIDISVIHGTGTYNEDGSIDFKTTDNVSYHYVPEAEKKEKEVITEDSFDAKIMIERMPFEYNSEVTSVSEKQTDEDGSVYYHLSNDGSTITGTIGVDKNFIATYGIPTSPEEAISKVMEKGINGSNKYFENDSYYLVLMLSGYTDTNCAIYHAYLIPKDGNASDQNVYFAKMYFYNKDKHTGLEEFTGIKNALNNISGENIFEYTYQDVINTLSTLKEQM